MLKVLKAIKSGWKNLSTADKVGFVIDCICGAGCALVSHDIGDKLAEGHTKLGRACIRTLVYGGSLAAGQAAGNALRENYGDAAASLIDKARGKVDLKNPHLSEDGRRVEWEVHEHA